MLRILVVDDEVAITDLVTALLCHWGHQACSADSGEAALAVAALFRPDVVLLDLAMPGLDGVEVARRLRAMPCYRGLLVVAMTGLGEAQSRGMGAGPHFHLRLPKPVAAGDLERILAWRSALGASG